MHTPAWMPQDFARVHVRQVAAQHAATELALNIAQHLRQAIADRGVAVLSVSGGKSPIAMFEALRKQVLDWRKVRITLVDERCVPTSHADSNAHLVHTHLLKDLAAHAAFVGMVTQETDPLPSPMTLAKAAGLSLNAAGATDVLVLGMGADGHTASLFPEAPNLAEALDLNNPHTCEAIELTHPPANAPYARITQTLAAIVSAKHIVLPIAGADKLATLQQACVGADMRWPVSFVLHQTQTPVELWITP